MPAQGAREGTSGSDAGRGPPSRTRKRPKRAAPVASLVLFWALLVKVTGDADDNPTTFRLVSILLVVASALYIIPQIYGVEAGDQGGLGGLTAAFVVGDDLTLPYAILNLSLLGFAATGGALFVWFMRKSKFEPAETA